jgi:dipeptidyl aminopeptidase/acylaminoacyl peptidase
MKKTVLVMMALAGAVLAAQPAVLTPEQTLERRGISELELSPDGARMVFTVAEPVKDTARQRNLWLLDVEHGSVRQLTFSTKSDSSPRWAPDGRTIAFLSDRDGAAQLYLLPMGGGEAERITNHKDRIESFRWSPDGQRLAFLMPEAKSDAWQQRDKDKDDAHVAEKEERLSRVWMVEVGSRATRPITSAPFRIGQIEFAPDGDHLIAAASAKPHEDRFNEAIYRIDLQDGRFTPIAAPRGPMGALAVSPDGKTIAYVCAREDGPEAHDLCLQPAAGGAARNLTGTAIDRPISQPKWIDGQRLTLNVARGFQTSAAIVGSDGRVLPLDGVTGNPSALARASNGTLVYAGETATRAPELWIKRPTAPPRAITTFNEQWTTRPVVAPEFVKYKSADGTEIEAALLKPSALGHQPWPRAATRCCIPTFAAPPDTASASSRRIAATGAAATSRT